jgi:hypothetical protein
MFNQKELKIKALNKNETNIVGGGKEWAESVGEFFAKNAKRVQNVASYAYNKFDRLADNISDSDPVQKVIDGVDAAKNAGANVIHGLKKGWGRVFNNAPNSSSAISPSTSPKPNNDL